MAEIKFLGYLSEKVGQENFQVILEKPAPLKEICLLPFNEEDVLILIGQKKGHFDSVIEDKSSVTIMPILSGG